MVQWVIADRVDLSKDAQRQQVGAPEALMLPGDNEAHRWEITVLNNGEAAELAGASVAGYFLRSDGETVAVVGSVNGNVISVVLAQECYAFEGLMRAIVRVTLNGVITTVIQRLFRVQQDIGDQIIDPGEVIPDIDELLAQIAAMETATAAANAAAAAASGIAAQATMDAKACGAAAMIDLDNMEWEAGAFSTSTGEPSSNSRLIRTPDYYLIDKGASITFTGVSTDRVHQAFFYDTNKAFISPRSSAVPYVIPDGAFYVRFVYGFSSGSGQTVNGYGGVSTTAADWDITYSSALENLIDDTASAERQETKNPTFNAGYAYTTNGITAEYTAVASFSTVRINVVEGQRYKVTAHGSNTCLPWATGDQNNVILRRTGDVTVDETITIAAGEDALFVNGFTAEKLTVYLLNADGTISELIKAVSQLNAEVNPSIGNYSTAALWESGQIGPTNGNMASSTARLRTTAYIPDDVYRIYAGLGYIILYAYDKTNSDEFIGVWTGTEFDKVSSGITHTDIFMSGIKASYPQYKYKLVWSSGITGYAADPAVDYYHINIYNAETWETLPTTLHTSIMVNLGDSIFGLFDAPTDISSFIANGTGATTYNCAFGGTRAVGRDGTGVAHYFDLSVLVDAIVSGDFTDQQNAVDALADESEKAIYAHLAMLKTIDFNTVDVLTLSFGTNDYGASNAIGSVGNGDATTFIGAIEEALYKLITAYPKMRIFVCTPIFRMATVGDNKVNADTVQDSNGKTLLDFVNAVKAVGAADYVGVIDNHYIGINATNWRTFLNDGTHPNEEGRVRIARAMIKQLY